MTYCIGIKASDGLVFASDSRTNAGLDNVNIYSKMFTYDVGDRTIIIVTSGNLGTSQAVFKSIQNDLDNNSGKQNLKSVNHKVMFDRIESGTFIIAGALIGNKLKISGIEPKILKKEISILKKTKNKILIITIC